MHPRTRLAALAAGLAAVAALTAGCGHSGSPAKAASSAHKAVMCGSSKTAANVPVKVEVVRGSVACSTALAVENAYTAAVAAGKAPGNGGGGPIAVSGWSCAGLPTPVSLQTGDVSKCQKDGTEILTVLPPLP